MRSPRLKLLQLAAAGCLLLFAPSVWGQTPLDAVFVVTALDVSPSQVAGGLAVLKPYRDTARKEAGNLGVDLLQEGGAANRFMIFETWQNKDAYEANEKGAGLA